MDLKWITRKTRNDRRMRIDSLARTGQNAFSLPKLQDGRWNYPVVRITSTSLSLKGIIEGSYGGLYGKADSDQSHHLIEISVTIPLLGRDSSGESVVFGRHIVAGLKTDDKSGSISHAIAKATVKSKANSLAVVTEGLADAATASLRNVAGQTLTAESARTFGQGVGDCLKWAVEKADKTTENARPAALFVPVNRIDETGSLCYALGQISSGNSRKEASARLHALRTAGDTRALFSLVDSTLVAAVFHRFQIRSNPTASQKNLAREVLRGKQRMPEANSATQAFDLSVLPYIRDDGAITSLGHLAPASRIQAQPWPPKFKDLEQPRTEIRAEQLDLQAVLDIGLTALADVHNEGETRFCSFKSWSTYKGPGAPNTIILNEHYGAGIRASIRYMGSEISGGATALAAKVTLDGKAASFSIDILGVDLEQMPSIGAFASGCTTAFDAQTLSLIGGIWSEVNSVITAHDNEDPNVEMAKKLAWKPCLTGVTLDLGATELQSKAGDCGPVAFALNMIAEGTFSGDAVRGAPNDEYSKCLSRFYSEHCESGKPSSTARKQAKLILGLGL